MIGTRAVNELGGPVIPGTVYHDLRLKYLAPFDSSPNVNTFQLLLRSVDESLIKDFVYIYKSGI